ncbi:RNA polymerase sigma-54 factor [Achromobacter xylosoxidans]|jgi:RNA polymerase sigma-54 factor|uniref:RNA polymerase sigma-54 factor n=1 Tax=Achromobacter ruhlandii TaxID=72557 RepID=A0A6S7E5J4_9BURK|nr:RNA polymerase factor sigma-54 [Achromobacter ruhlandii]ALX84270.1 RNA polymerase sigma-54 factor [Achromobacter denitrificans]OCZ67478.1 RNA polymerase sigma-54 factor [Achromobacter xylosoxidans]MCI1836511.1 RNA polymerase factor sigma-54 [Achromobacter ruhlandii]OCZ69203.1 RNA polymerase sigma-54 factor [Achromobacter xylosoxidans]CAB3896722.1 RNA polymerase sigma-54 factor [Achromobacter ruhlandii]
MQELRLRQQMTLAPRLQQSVKLLQMSALEFTTAVELALASNPFLEEAEEQAAGPADIAEGRPDMDSANPAAEAAPAPSSSTPTEEAPAAAAEYGGDYPSPARADGEDRDLGQWASAPVSMREKLSLELGSYRLGARDRLLAEFIIDSLDEDGYLRTPTASLCDDLSPDFSPPPDDAEWLTALRLVQQLDAPGLGARDLQECLALQLEAAPGLSASLRALALRIVREQIDRLAKNDSAGLRRALNCSDDELRDACALIRGLDPKPGRRYDAQAPVYVVPDVFVDKWRSRWRVVPNRGAMPQARLHQVYADLFRRARLDDRSPMAQELQEARWLVRNVEQRYTTIQRVAEAIVKRQQTFFEYGEVALRPLMLKEVADDLDMHESTVSRATVSKYMVTPRGVFEFRHFFSRELPTDSGGTCSAAAVRALIKELIEAEDPAMPLSDVALAQQLANNGIVLARRTVSKYRGQLRLPPAELRREH